jgi:hypothetical protein
MGSQDFSEEHIQMIELYYNFMGISFKEDRIKHVLLGYCNVKFCKRLENWKSRISL